jgi:hypothetical protein
MAFSAVTPPATKGCSSPTIWLRAASWAASCCCAACSWALSALSAAFFCWLAE